MLVTTLWRLERFIIAPKTFGNLRRVSSLTQTRKAHHIVPQGFAYESDTSEPTCIPVVVYPSTHRRPFFAARESAPRSPM